MFFTPTHSSAVQKLTAVTAFFSSKQLLLFVFAKWQKQTTVTAYLIINELLLFAFTELPPKLVRGSNFTLSHTHASNTPNMAFFVYGL